MSKAKRPVMIRIDGDDWEGIRELSKEDECSMAEYIRRLVKRSLAQRIKASP